MLVYVNLPLFKDDSFTYTIPLEGITYRFNFYYNSREESWLFDIRYSNGEAVVLGEALVAQYPMLLDYNLEGLSGFLWMEPIGENQNQTVINPFEIHQYYTLRYYYDRIE